ncbi:MAG: LysR substrate-binding domain-containing protein, partial [Pseudomonadota bacterium]|nr:LysR substrate-binding domain-containing protein [Pseudomonadota bacterium]
LRSRNVELFIARLASPLSDEDLSTEDLFDEPFTVYAGLDSPFARRRRVPLSDLMGEHWVLPPYDSVPGAFIAGIFGSFGLTPPRPTVETYSAHLSAALVGTGNFVGMLPKSVLHFHARRLSVKALPVELPERRFKVVMVRLKNRSLSPLAELPRSRFLVRQMQMHARVAAHELLEDGRQHARDDDLGASDSQFARVGIGKMPQVQKALPHLVEHGNTALEQRIAVCSRFNPDGATVEEVYAQSRFQFGDGFRDHRDGDRQALRCFRHALAFGHSLQHMKIAQLEPPAHALDPFVRRARRRN